MDVKKEEEKLLMEMFFYGAEMIENTYLAAAYSSSTHLLSCVYWRRTSYWCGERYEN